MYGFPTSYEWVAELAALIKQEDDAKEKRVGPPQKSIKMRQFGVVSIERQDQDSPEYIALCSSDTYNFQNDHRVASRVLPNASIIKNTDGEIFIACNPMLEAWLKQSTASLWQQSMADGIIFHELAHYLLGHFDTHPRLMLDQLDPDELDKSNNPTFLIAQALLKGAVFIHEFETDLRAMQMIDDPTKIIALRGYFAAMSDTLGIRLENFNQMHRLMTYLEDPEWEQNIPEGLPTITLLLFPDAEDSQQQ